MNFKIVEKQQLKRDVEEENVMNHWRQSKNTTDIVKCLSLFLCGLFFVFIHCASVYGQSNDNFYSIHVSSCKSVDNALKVVSMITEKGYSAYYRYEDVPGKGLWYRVYAEKSVKDTAGDHIVEGLKEAAISNYLSLRKTNGQQHQIFGPPTKGGWCLRIGSFMLEQNAVKEAERMQRYRYETLIARIHDGENVWNKVFLLVDGDKSVADMAGEALQDQNIITFFKTEQRSNAMKLSENIDVALLEVEAEETSEKKVQTIQDNQPIEQQSTSGELPTKIEKKEVMMPNPHSAQSALPIRLI
jgi:hypothetical protein